jgi:hypothetical protein
MSSGLFRQTALTALVKYQPENAEAAGLVYMLPTVYDTYTVRRYAAAAFFSGDVESAGPPFFAAHSETLAELPGKRPQWDTLRFHIVISDHVCAAPGRARRSHTASSVPAAKLNAPGFMSLIPLMQTEVPFWPGRRQTFSSVHLLRRLAGTSCCCNFLQNGLTPYKPCKQPPSTVPVYGRGKRGAIARSRRRPAPADRQPAGRHQHPEN